MLIQKSSLRAAFFLIFFWVSSHVFANSATKNIAGGPINSYSTIQQIAQSPVWAALLHFREEKLQIKDRSFILSFDDFSLANELLKTIALLSGPERVAAACRYPARYLWIQTQTSLPEIDLGRCSEFSEYMEKVPADHIALVFASENLSQPASMMGHIFLKLSGTDSQNMLRQHSISFYTDAGTLNLPKLLVENFVTGMNGFYALAPYEEALRQYSVIENRSIWEYQLKLGNMQLALLRRHLYELRYVQFKYHFHSYNCASLIKELLVLVEPAIAQNTDLWTTPVDVLKHANRAKLIENTEVVLSTQWSLRSLLEKLPEADSSHIKYAIDRQELPQLESPDRAEETFLMLEFALSYNNFLYEKKKIALPDWKDRNSDLLKRKSTLPKDYAIEVTGVTNPLNSFEDSQFSVGGLVRAGERYARFGFLPASHTLLDDQPASFSESELKLFELVLLQSQRQNSLTIDKFTLYATRSLMPWTKVTGGVSGSMKIAYENQFDHLLSSQHAFGITGDAGFTKSVGKDVNMYALAGGGAGANGGNIFLQATSMVGILIRELSGMKSIVSIEKIWNPLGNAGSNYHLNFAQKISLAKQHALELTWKKIFGDVSDATVEESSVLYKYSF